MKSNFEVHTYYKSLAVYQILGGSLGIILTAYYFSSFTLNNNLIILIGLAISMYVYSILCGLLIFLKKITVYSILRLISICSL